MILLKMCASKPSAKQTMSTKYEFVRAKNQATRKWHLIFAATTSKPSAKQTMSTKYEFASGE
ncbi:MAG: hypothetical protein IJ326_05110 [Lachnospiraceae bacterium]|nr:hypothetical protein [Lachnospiraceae bacterium]